MRNLPDVARSHEARRADPKDRWTFAYEDAIREWGTAMEKGAAFAAVRPANLRYVVVEFEDLFVDDVGRFVQACRDLAQAVGLDPQRFDEKFLRKIHLTSMRKAETRATRAGALSRQAIDALTTAGALTAYARLRTLAQAVTVPATIGHRESVSYRRGRGIVSAA